MVFGKKLNTNTYYSILGLDSTCTYKQIKSKFYELSSLHHPDKHSSEKDKQIHLQEFLKIKQAYEVLGNPAKRLEYDNSLNMESGLRPSSITNDFTKWSDSSTHPMDWMHHPESHSYPFDGQDQDQPFLNRKYWTLLGAFWILFSTSIYGCIVFYNTIIEDSPENMKRDNERHRSKALILDYNGDPLYSDVKYAYWQYNHQKKKEKEMKES